MRILKIIILLLPAMLLAQTTTLTKTEIINFHKGVSHHTTTLESLSSDFVQTKYMQLMEKEAVSTGKLYYRSPDILKWEYQTPYNYILLFKEAQLFINDDGDKSVTSLKSNKLFEKLLALISGSVNGKLMADTENFDISYSRSGNSVSAVIVPRDASLKSMFNEIILVFDADHLLDSVKLMEEAGDYTQIKFKNISINPSLDPAVFQH